MAQIILHFPCSFYNGGDSIGFIQVNPEMVPEFEKAGLSFVGKDESGRRMEVYLEEIVALISSITYIPAFPIAYNWSTGCRLLRYPTMSSSLVHSSILNSSQDQESHLHFS